MLLITVVMGLLTMSSGIVDETADQAAVEAVVENVYKTISFEGGSKPDWDSFRSLMVPGAILVPARQRGVRSVEEFIDGFNMALSNPESQYAKRGFSERQIHAVTEVFSGVAHVFTTYETVFSDDGQLLGRGINSMQLIKINDEWKISSIAWDDEIGGVKIPAKYLQDK